MSKSAESPSTMSANSTASSGPKSIASIALIVGIVGLLIAVFGMITGLTSGEGRPVLSVLLGFSFWYAILLGCLFLVQLFYLFDAGWAIIVRRQLEHILGGMPWVFVALVPLVILPFLIGTSTDESGGGAAELHAAAEAVHGDAAHAEGHGHYEKWKGPNGGIIWKWLNPEQTYHGHKIAEDPLYLNKAVYLNAPFFFVRVLLYFIVACGLAFLLRKWSFQNDVNADVSNILNARKLSAIGIPLTAFLTTFSAFDFYMSLSYHWFSTMFGVWHFALAMRLSLATAVITCFILSTRGYLKGIYNQHHQYLLGCLCLAFTVFWAYISFSQYFLIYNANIPEETFWYNIRELAIDGGKNQWWWVSMGLVFGFFLAPFLTLLFYRVKVIPAALVAVCGWILAFGLLDLYFNIIPTQVHAPESPTGYASTPFITGYMLYDLAAIIGVGGIVIAAVLRSMSKAEPIPIHDPRINESIHYHA